MSEEETTLGVSVEKRLRLRGENLEVAIDIAAGAEPQIQDLLVRFIGDRGQHFRVERYPCHSDSLSHFESCPRFPDCGHEGAWTGFECHAASTFARATGNRFQGRSSSMRLIR